MLLLFFCYGGLASEKAKRRRTNEKEEKKKRATNGRLSLSTFSKRTKDASLVELEKALEKFSGFPTFFVFSTKISTKSRDFALILETDRNTFLFLRESFRKLRCSFFLLALMSSHHHSVLRPQRCRLVGNSFSIVSQKNHTRNHRIGSFRRVSDSE